MAVAKISVPYLELGEEFGLAGGADEQGEFETKPYLCAWGDRGNLINQLAGTTYQSGGINGRWVNSGIPYQLPDNPRLYFRSCTWRPEGALVPNTTPIGYSHAVVLATFRQPEFNWQAADDPGFLNSLSQDPDENESLLLATQELDFGREWLTIPNSSVKFKSDSGAIKSPKGRSYLVVTMQLTWHRYPVMPMGKIRSYADTVNDATFLGCAKGTVYFEGVRTTREANTDGTATQKVQMTLKWRVQDWNKDLRDDGITWDFVVDKAYAGGAGGNSDTSCTYAYKDFSQLLL